MLRKPLLRIPLGRSKKSLFTLPNVTTPWHHGKCSEIGRSVEVRVVQVAALMDRLQQDPWRANNPFSSEIQQALDKILDPATPEESVIATLNGWLARHQPCLFGRIAAKNDLISYCLLSQNDLSESDERIRDKIKEARRIWTRRGFEGSASAFRRSAAFAWCCDKQNGSAFTESEPPA